MEFNIDKKVKKFNKENDKRLREFTLNLMEEFENYFLEKEGITFKEYFTSNESDVYESIEKTINIIKNTDEDDELLAATELVVKNVKKSMETFNKVWSRGMTIQQFLKQNFEDFKEKQNEKIN